MLGLLYRYLCTQWTFSDNRVLLVPHWDMTLYNFRVLRQLVEMERYFYKPLITFPVFYIIAAGRYPKKFYCIFNWIVQGKFCPYLILVLFISWWISKLGEYKKVNYYSVINLGKPQNRYHCVWENLIQGKNEVEQKRRGPYISKERFLFYGKNAYIKCYTEHHF